MRSRYTAFVKEDKDYLLRTWHESTRPKELDFEPLHWRSLKIEAFMPLSETTARVKFVAKARGRCRKYDHFERKQPICKRKRPLVLH